MYCCVTHEPTQSFRKPEGLFVLLQPHSSNFPFLHALAIEYTIPAEAIAYVNAVSLLPVGQENVYTSLSIFSQNFIRLAIK